MAALPTLAEHSSVCQSPINLAPRSGVITLFGYGISVLVERGHLILKDGVGSERQHFRLPRVGHGLERLVVIGNDGSVSLAALRWLASQNAAFVMLERNGKVSCVTGPVRPTDARLRRAQALAHQTDQALQIARELIDQKLAGQEKVARETLKKPEAAQQILRWRSGLAEANNLGDVRRLESMAAVDYWSAWRGFPIGFPKADLVRTPDHWRKFDTRKSLLSGSQRLATNPVNAMLNYLYAILESESRLAVAAMGLDPGLGFIHMDTPARDSLACDLMEPIRPLVDSCVLGWLIGGVVSRKWFYEEPNGNCRLMADLATRLSETAPTWKRAVGPLAEKVAQALWKSKSRAPSERILPTRLTQKRRSQGRGRDFIAKPVASSRPENICANCGVVTQGAKHCVTCGRQVSSKKLTELAKVGRIVARSPESRAKHSRTIKKHLAARRTWLLSSNNHRLDEHTYIKEIQPRLINISVSRLAQSIGVSEAYASNIRKGRFRPHPMHWKTLAELVGLQIESQL